MAEDCLKCSNILNKEPRQDNINQKTDIPSHLNNTLEMEYSSLLLEVLKNAPLLAPNGENLLQPTSVPLIYTYS